MTDAKQLFTPEQVKEDGKNRVAKTTGQAGLAGFIVTVGLWLAHQLGWHGEMPTEVALALGGILTSFLGGLTNLGRLRGQA